MKHSEEVAILVTIRARRDPAFPNELFITARRFLLPHHGPSSVVESVSIAEVLEMVGSWLRESRNRPSDESGDGPVTI